MGLHNNNARMHVELNKEPNTIEEAVHHVVHYFEAARNTNTGNHQEEDRDRYQRTRQVKPNKDYTENGHDVGKKANNEETARQGGKKNEKPDQTEQPKEADMICISKQDLEGMLKDMLADMKGKEHNSNDKSQFSGKPTGTNNENKKRIVCFTCQEPGHISRNCWRRMNRSTNERHRGFHQQH